MLAECVINISEGRDRSTVGTVAAAAGDTLLDVHCDPDHHRSVLTLGGPLDRVVRSARSVVARALATIDLTAHRGVHPRFGVVDVVPFVPLEGTIDDAVGARDRLAHWAGAELGIPCFLYGPGRTLPEVRREAFRSLAPDAGPPAPHPTGGAMAVGARRALVAYNLWITGATGSDGSGALPAARAIAGAVRGPAVRARGLAVGNGAQVSCNLVDPTRVGPAEIFDDVVRRAREAGMSVERAELVGLLPESVLRAVPRHRWADRDLGDDRTIEHRLAHAVAAGDSDPG